MNLTPKEAAERREAAERLLKMIGIPSSRVYPDIPLSEVYNAVTRDTRTVAEAILEQNPADDEEAKPELSDDWHLDEPLAYLVKNFDITINEYRIFTDEGEARRYAEEQEEIADEEGEPEDWQVYPLYAGHPLERR